MAYCTVAQVRERLPLITAEVRDDDVVAGFIAQAVSLIDGEVASRFKVPLPEEAGNLIQYICMDLACGLLLENVYGSDVPVVSELAGVLVSRAMELLGELSAGRILIPGADGQALIPIEVRRQSLHRGEISKSQFFAPEEVLLPEDDE